MNVILELRSSILYTTDVLYSVYVQFFSAVTKMVWKHRYWMSKKWFYTLQTWITYLKCHFGRMFQAFFKQTAHVVLPLHTYWGSYACRVFVCSSLIYNVMYTPQRSQFAHSLLWFPIWSHHKSMTGGQIKLHYTLYCYTYMYNSFTRVPMVTTLLHKVYKECPVLR